MNTLTYHVDIPKMAKTIVLSKIIKKKAFFKKCSPVYFEKEQIDALPNQNYVKVRNVQTGICGSDISLFTLHQSLSMSLAVMPSQIKQYMGHETVGVVEEVGTDVQNLKVGDRVIMRKYLPNCSTKGLPHELWCDACKRGDYVMCANMGEASQPQHMVGAGYGDYYYAPEDCVMKIDDCVTNDQATLYEPCAVSLHAVMKRLPKAGEKVVVLGGGMIGLNIVQFVKLLQPDCTVYLLEKSKIKQELALKIGADKIISGNPYLFLQQETGALYYHDKKNKNQVLVGGVDVVYDSIGASWAFNMGLRVLRARGTYVKVGIQMTKTTIDETPIWNQELNVIGVNSYGLEEYQGQTYQSFDLVDKFVKEGKLKLDGFITQRYPISKYKDGFKKVLFEGNDAIKVVLECNK